MLTMTYPNYYTIAMVLLLPLSHLPFITSLLFPLSSTTSTSRSQFLSVTTTTLTTNLLNTVRPPPQTTTTTTAQLPLLFLPVGGALILPLIIDDTTTYGAIVDTGSPFLIAPPSSIVDNKKQQQQPSRRHRSKKKQFYPPSNEQYGQDIIPMTWNEGSIRLSTSRLINHVSFAVPSSVDDNSSSSSATCFVGLIAIDDNRPTFMKQCGYRSFRLDYPGRLLTLSSRDMLSSNDNKEGRFINLFDFSPYGSNVHHYGGLCSMVRVLKNGKWMTLSTFLTTGRDDMTKRRRPIVAVFDSGLTGCIISDSLRREMTEDLNDIDGMDIVLETTSTTNNNNINSDNENNSRVNNNNDDGVVRLISDEAHWILDSFSLPWFGDDTERHPHVIACGVTFLVDRCLTVDCLGGRAMIV